jgi:asparagine synthase (glutamine-hydrolysing)
MCGINAIFAYGSNAPPVSADEVVRVRDAMINRGPDGDGLWLSDDRRVGLGHRRLAIIDLSPEGAQPMASADGAVRITYNGEIFNYRALRAELEAEGRHFATESDTEVLLQLYERDGAAMVGRLRGMFALALWDERKQGLLLARDGFGIKPLYVADDGKTVRVASQVKALLAGDGIDTAPEAAGHAGFFLFGYVPEPHTLYRGIRSLPAGATMWIDGDGVGEAKVYFDPATTLAAAGETAAVDLGAALADSIDHHLVADVPVGVFLSAGLDSTTITGLAAKHHGAGLDTVTLGFDAFRGTADDEVPLAEAVAKIYDTRHRTRWIDGEAFQDQREALLAAMDQPTIDGVNVYFVAREAADLGLKVALSGLGGDEMFGGYDTFRQVPRLVGGLGWIPGIGAIGAGVRSLVAPLMKPFVSPKYAAVLEYAGGYGDAYMLRRGLFMPWELADLIGPDLARQGLADLDHRRRLAATVNGVDGAARRVTALECAWYMRSQLLRDADWAGMAHSLEIRVPLVDPFLFRQLAPALGRPGGPDKQAMAATPVPPLPDAVRRRPKSGFAIPVRDWLQGPDSGERGLRGWARQVYAAQTAA